MSPPNNDSKLTRRALLPAGLRDVLPPDAAHEAATVENLIGCFENQGYERIKPPLVEFEDSLFSGPGAAMTESTFRLMDPISRRMMGVRADVTVQVARVAATRLGHVPRPLRLCYSGEVLRVTPGDLNPERELVQVGAELVGADTIKADAEVILLAVDALRSVGTKNISVDITAPQLVPKLLPALGIDLAAMPELRTAIDRKDPAAVERFAGEASNVLTQLMSAAGERSEGLRRLAALDLPDVVRPIVERLEAVAALVADEEPTLKVTIDPLENRGFEYYTGLGFSLFSRGVRGELGRGGRYQVDGLDSEDSCGLTLYMETVLRAIDPPVTQDKLYLPTETSRATALELRNQGWITLSGLAPEIEPRIEAERLGCTHILWDGKPVRLDSNHANRQS
ncbi:MAG: ATP phosphoribosyltransferase regulatory subunit [Alphaproteobacteria bacterium]|nr:ATP phosphoribosyltransferase regulatory subunit [Alphaproteobacteria bacterium]